MFVEDEEFEEREAREREEGGLNLRDETTLCIRSQDGYKAVWNTLNP